MIKIIIKYQPHKDLYHYLRHAVDEARDEKKRKATVEFVALLSTQRRFN